MKNPELQTFVDTFQDMVYGIGMTEAKEKRICVICKNKVSGFTDERAEREYEISGTCQACQDGIFMDTMEK